METTDVQVAGSEGCCKQEDIGDWTIAQQPIPSLLEASPSMISRGAQFQVEDLFPPITSSPAKEMTAPEKVPSIKEEDSMEYSCDDKPLISNSPPDTVTENNTTQEKPSTEQPAPAQTQSGSTLTLPILFSSPSLSKQMMVVLTPAQKIDAPATVSSHSVPVPYTTRYYWKRKLVKEKDGIYTRKYYVRRSEAIQCRKCNKERIMSTHCQYFGNWYCEETDTKPFAVWKAELLKRGYGKKKF
ncbi:uncharacterized protein LOC107739614 isoform X2 [Sinocyclocheilus rhinocerous]|uniref:uncharacterized protein LOC107739614 isoform X2 n=1 Tax=Sinocyclocheilus rhinocerous TaxID=307959 RepID=UPI0007B83AE1|nr:PREDICTED: uncharacterized protein LOC107739614 isoform X2 [Sinocyclocheilus rhinocerous]